VLSVKLMNEKDDVIVPKGYSVVSMQADPGGIANLVRQGDRVDVRAYFTKNELIPRTTSKTILAGVRVFALDGKTKPDDDVKRNGVRSISLLIRKADEEAWTYAQKLGEISLSLGSPGDYENSDDVSESSESGQQFLQWLADLRQEQERLRAAAVETVEPDVADTPDLKPAPQKKTWDMLRLHQGKMTLFRFTEGNPVPEIISQTVDSDGEQPTDDSGLSDESTKDDLDHLLGEDSPFFQPRDGTDGADSRNFKRARR
jgi:pilus assembly protein CpaB